MKDQQNKPQQTGREGSDEALDYLGESETQQQEHPQENVGYPNEERVTETDTPERVRGNEDPAGTGLPSKE